jgi:hypothetical protein
MDLAVDLASSRRLLIRILLDQGGFELMVGVCRGVSRGLMLRLMDAHTCKVEIYRPPSLSWRKGLSRCLDAVLPVEAVESGFCWKFELGVRVGIIQQHFSRDLGISEHLIKLRLIDHSWNMIPQNPITLPLLKTLFQALDVLPVQFAGLTPWEM